MIHLTSIIDLHIAQALAPAKLDPLVSRVLDVAEFETSYRDREGNVVQIWKLRRRLGCFPAGSKVSLRQLHELLKA
jgi:hypothetical protein